MEEYTLPPVTVFLETFDTTTAGTLPTDWTTGFDPADAGKETSWQLGNPFGGPLTGPPSANSPPNCFGTNLTADYGLSSSTWLRTPPGMIDLTTASEATVVFWQWLDMDPYEKLDSGKVRVLDASVLPGTVDLLGVVRAEITGRVNNWRRFSAAMPAAAIGQSVALEFVFVSDDDNTIEASGWDIDNVEVTTPAP